MPKWKNFYYENPNYDILKEWDKVVEELNADFEKDLDKYSRLKSIQTGVRLRRKISNALKILREMRSYSMAYDREIKRIKEDQKKQRKTGPKPHQFQKKESSDE